MARTDTNEVRKLKQHLEPDLVAAVKEVAWMSAQGGAYTVFSDLRLSLERMCLVLGYDVRLILLPDEVALWFHDHEPLTLV